MTLAGVRIPRWIGLAIGLSIALSVIGSIAHTQTAHAASTTLKVAYIYDFGSGANDTSGPGSGSSIFVNALTGSAPLGTYKTADLSKTVSITNVTVASIDLGGAPVLTPFDTALLYQVCDFNSHAGLKTAINSFLNSGGKVMLFDGDRCAPGFGGQANYSGFVFPFSTSSPGPQGAGGSYTKIEASTLTAGLSLGPQTGDSVGDANAFTSFSGAWCASITGKNILGTTGFIEAYARTAALGLVIYEGEDFWFTFGPTPHLRLVFDNMLKQSWNPDGLPCTLPPSGISLAPATQTQNVGGSATVTAKVVDANGNPKAGITVTIKVTAGPNAGLIGSCLTDATGTCNFTYSSTKAGTDTLQASFTDALSNVHTSNNVTVVWKQTPANLTLAPPTATNTVGTQHCVTATVTDSSGKPVPGVTVNFTVTGMNPTSGSGVTDANGQVKFCYKGTKTGDDTITATAVGGTNPSNTAKKTWTAGPPATLVLTPKTATNVVGNPHTVTATVKDSFGNLVPGATVTFTVTGANSASGTGVTNASGQAMFTYTGTHFGTDVITASASATAKDTATKIWTLAALDNFKCYSVHSRHGAEHGERVVTLSDQFGTAQVEVEEPRIFCNPAGYNGSTIITPTAHLKGYQIESRKEFRERFVEVTNKFGTQTLEVEERAILAEPASKALPGQNLGPVPITLNNFECYSVEGKGKRPAPTATLTDQFGKATVAVRRPVLLCNPTKKNTEGIGPVASGPDHLVCYAITPRPNTNHPVVLTRDQFGVETLRIIRPELLCVPSNKKEIPRPPHEDKD